ncbi:MAG: IPT/TIG domain-containing protein [Thermodesulfobacteriota bacterium]|nr:IPT/TIG domain-containing protein [Thermodesulfobacteriota bacterium]
MGNKLAMLMIAVVIIFSFLAACAKPAPTPPPKPPVAISITPPSGKPGTSITITGTNFVPGEEVKANVIMRGVPLILGNGGVERHIANEKGEIKIVSKIPLKDVAEPGMYTITATGDKGSAGKCLLEVVK